MSETPVDARPSSVLRFDLSIQRNQTFVYTAAFVTGLLGKAFGIFPLALSVAIFIFVYSVSAAIVFYFLFRAGIDRRVLNPIWMANNVFLATLGVYASGGIVSPFYIWYMAAATAAAFAGGKTDAYWVSLANGIAYIGLLVWMGQATFFNQEMLLAITRMLFVWGASYFFLVGIANVTEKRLRIRQLESEESRKVAELTRLTQELADANRRIQESDRLKSQFLANMSHELRTPMNSIIGFSEILMERIEGKVEPKYHGFVKHIHASGQHLLGIINDILDLSKIEAGKMEVYPEFFAIGPVVEGVCNMTRGMTRTQRKFVVEIAPELPQIETDLAKFKQVLFNLLSNAVKFSPPDRPITIRVRFENDEITVAVSDEGIGIDAAYHDVIFDEFRQVDGTARREFGGTGLGLALVRKFVELQGGRVGVESTLGKGSTFFFTLPVRSRAAVITRPPEIVPMPVADRVLVVEDDANAYELIASALGTAGYLAIRARHGEEALKLAREMHPVAVTLDLVLPGVDGWEVLKRLKSDAATSAIPIVIISKIDNRDLGVALGAADYFVKPVDRDRLLQRLREIASRTPTTRPRLLLIDDDQTVHSLLDEELTTLGYSVESAYSGEDGLRVARDRAPDVIILDLMMPGMSGFDVATSLKDNPSTANIPILVLTSKDLTNTDRNELQSKVTSFVQKGKSAREQLVREIRRLERRASLGQ